MSAVLCSVCHEHYDPDRHEDTCPHRLLGISIRYVKQWDIQHDLNPARADDWIDKRNNP